MYTEFSTYAFMQCGLVTVASLMNENLGTPI